VWKKHSRFLYFWRFTLLSHVVFTLLSHIIFTLSHIVFTLLSHIIFTLLSHIVFILLRRRFIYITGCHHRQETWHHRYAPGANPYLNIFLFPVVANNERGLTRHNRHYHCYRIVVTVVTMIGAASEP
jgi:hypothetical protein